MEKAGQLSIKITVENLTGEQTDVKAGRSTTACSVSESTVGEITVDLDCVSCRSGHGNMSPPKRGGILYKTVICLCLSLTVGSFVVVSRPDNICSTSLCYFTAGCAASGATGLVSAILWGFWSDGIRSYVSLMATMTTGRIFNLQMIALTYLEVVRILRHIQQLTMALFGGVACLNEEMAHLIKTARSSLLQEQQVDDINKGLGDIVTRFSLINQTQGQLKNSIDVGFQWLESRGLGCRYVVSKPFEMCIQRSEAAVKDCLSRGAGSLCDLIHISVGVCQSLEKSSKVACQDYGPTKVAEILSALRAQMRKWISEALRMRIGMILEIRTTTQVLSFIRRDILDTYST